MMLFERVASTFKFQPFGFLRDVPLGNVNKELLDDIWLASVPEGLKYVVCLFCKHNSQITINLLFAHCGS